MQGYHWSKEGIQWVPFREEWYITGKGLDLGEEPRQDKTRQDSQDKTRQCFIWSLIQSYVYRLYLNNL